MLNNINARGLSKSKKVDVLNFPGAASSDIVNETDEVLKGKPESLIIHIGTQTTSVSSQMFKKLLIKSKRPHPIL